jgi:hypothetical protein
VKEQALHASRGGTALQGTHRHQPHKALHKPSASAVPPRLACTRSAAYRQATARLKGAEELP